MAMYLVCFDISDDKSRYRVVKALMHYGLRVQYSVFELIITTPTQLQELIDRLRPHTEDDDSIRLYRLCRNCQKQAVDLHEREIASLPRVVVV
mgnify:CR=1 FL=1